MTRPGHARADDPRWAPGAPVVVDTGRRTGLPGGMADVAVVGAGVVGLTAAVRLRQAGAAVTVLAADPPRRTVSAVAAAVWYPTRTGVDPRVLRWAAGAYDEFVRQAAAGVPGVVLRPTRMFLRDADTGVPWWGVVPADFSVCDRGEVPAPYTGLWRFTVPSVAMGPYLDWLVAELRGAGVVFRRRRLGRLDEAFEVAPVVVNATGLGAGVLCGDQAVHPARGRVVVVTNPGLVASVRDEDNPDGVTYVHPRDADVVLGGTFEPGQWDTAGAPGAAAAIVRRCARLVPELADARVLAERVGLRPVRHGGPRVEARSMSQGRRVVHAYGHGGAGVTLSWGCADEVAALALGGE
ncbi:MAG TPA: FAD-dependent oxidoreductase [Catenuloplanes sp.]